tara:strand:+ start:325 stop:903 length:579 start_codon:yes stop_codon:yes gene_type:complete
VNFIHERFVEDVSLGDRVIDYFHSNPEGMVKGPGTFGYSKGEHRGSTDNFIKKSIDMTVTSDGHETIFEFLTQLQIVLDEYIKIYPFCNSYAKFELEPGFNIQYYKPYEGYFSYHTERHGAAGISSLRNLAFMMYCNTINKRGGTEFVHQDVICKPEKGKVVIFPTDWTHTHRGITSPESKVIITGWYGYVN